MLTVKLFGAGQAEYLGQPLPGFPTQQAYLLLCYLLLNKQYPHPRERLAATFWGDYPTPLARKYFRNALWRLRQAFHSAGAPADEYLQVDDESISFAASSPFWLDVDLFESSVAGLAHLTGQQLDAGQAGSLAAAVELYSGDLLDPVYEDWCLHDRERLRLLYLNSLGKLMAFHGSHGAPERGLEYGERILALDNTRENTHRHMMRLYWQAGDRSAALGQYKRCTQILRQELGVRPMEATRQLYEQVIHSPTGPANLPEPRHSTALQQTPAPASLPPVAEYALQKLQRLQEMVEETNAELRQIERMIQQAFGNLQSG